jgi:hypothetical protein
MPRYEIWLKVGQQPEVEGEKLEVMTSNQPGGYNAGDVVIRKEDRVVAHFKNGEWVGCRERSPA